MKGWNIGEGPSSINEKPLKKSPSRTKVASHPYKDGVVLGTPDA